MAAFPAPITGVGVMCAAGVTTDEFWASLAAGETALTELDVDGFEGRGVFGSVVPDERLRERAAAYGVADPEKIERSSLLLLVAAYEAIEASGIDLDSVDRDRVGIVVGKCQTDNGRGETSPWIHAPAEDVAHRLGIGGPRIVVSTACAAGANSLGIARDKLWTREADIMLAGGVDVLSPTTELGFEAMKAIDSKPCSPYSRSGGLNLGEAAAVVVLERYEDAVARNAPVRAELSGYGLSADAYHATAPDPTGRGAAACVRRALDDAGLTTDDVDYVNGHGTGTTANDRMERKLMWSLFRERAATVPISSTKSFIGHSLGASGTVEATACVFALERQLLPPTVNFDGVATDLDFVPDQPRPAKVDVTVSANYAFGGNNCAIVLRRPGDDAPPSSAPPLTGRARITGIGALSGLGIGVEALADAFRLGASAIAPITAFDATKYGCTHGAAMCALDGKGYATAADWRHMDAITRQLLVATRLALGDAGLKLTKAERDTIAVFLGTSFGPASTGLDFARTSTAVSFSQVTLNAPTGKVCQVLGVRGPSTTITTGQVSGSLALAAALEHLAAGKCEQIVVLATDEFFEYLLRVRVDGGLVPGDGQPLPYDATHRGSVLGAAAIGLLLETPESAERGGRAGYCDVVSTYHASDARERLGFDPSGAVFRRAITGALERADWQASDVDLCVSWAGGHPDDDIEARVVAEMLPANVPVTAPKGITGDCESASGLVNIVAGALAIRDGIVPPTPRRDGGRLPDGLNLVTEPVTNAGIDTVLALDAASGSGSGCVATILTSPGGGS